MQHLLPATRALRRAGRVLATGATAILMLATTLGLRATPSANTDMQQDGLRQDKDALALLYHATDGYAWREQEGWLTDQPLDTWAGVTVRNGRVTELSLKNNRLHGQLPPQLTGLAHLQRLALPGNDLHGVIPSSLGDLAKLQHLDLRWNSLEGEIPDRFFQMERLYSLLLGSNRLTGSIPPSKDDRGSLQGLDLSYNRLTGMIPASLGSHFFLRVLALQDNQLAGAIPRAFGKLSYLQSMLLQRNRLDGPIPSELGQLRRLRHFDASDNDMTGPIPERFGDLPLLELANFAGNRLSGTVRVGSGNARVRFHVDAELCVRSPSLADAANVLCRKEGHATTLAADDILATLSAAAGPGRDGYGHARELLRALTVEYGQVAVVASRVPEWATNRDIETLAVNMNAYLRRAGFSLASSKDFARLLATYEGPEFELPSKSTRIGPDQGAGRHGIRAAAPSTDEVDADTVLVGLVQCEGTLDAPVHNYSSGFVTAEADASCELEPLVDTCPPVSWNLELEIQRWEDWLWFPISGSWVHVDDANYPRFSSFGEEWTNVDVSPNLCPSGENRLRGGVHYRAPLDTLTMGSPRPLNPSTTAVITGCKKPPGDCRFADYYEYNDAVNEYCHTYPLTSCKHTDSCSTLRTKNDRHVNCLNARLTRENSCFQGGDLGHWQQIEQRRQSIRKCLRIQKNNGCLLRSI